MAQETDPQGEVEITIDSRARLRTSVISPQAFEALQREFTHRNPARAKIDTSIAGLERTAKTASPAKKAQLRRILGPLYGQRKNEPIAIPTWKAGEGELSVPRGGTARARSILEEHGYAVSYRDARIEGSGPRATYMHHVDLWPFQEGMIQAGIAMQQGLWRSGTGSGKTTALIGAAARTGLCTLVIVWTQNLLDQWIRRVRAELHLREDEVGVIQGSTSRIRPITVGMQQTLWKKVDQYVGVFGFVASDEVHRTSSKTFLDVIDRFPAKYRIGVSAEERRKDKKEFLLYDTFGDVLADIDQDELVAGGFTLDVEVWIVETTFSCDWYTALSGEEKGARFRDLIDAAVEDSARNELIAELALEAGRGGEDQVLVFSHRVEHCRRVVADIARKQPRVGLLLGGKPNKAEFERTREGVVSGDVRIAVGTYAAVGTGTDLPSLARGVATTPIHTNKGFMGQVKGRICRAAHGTGKSDARLYVLWDREVFGLAPLRNYCKWSNTVKVRDAFTGEWVDGHERLAELAEDARAEREAGTS